MKEVNPVKARAVIALLTLSQIALFLAKIQVLIGFQPGR